MTIRTFRLFQRLSSVSCSPLHLVEAQLTILQVVVITSDFERISMRKNSGDIGSIPVTASKFANSFLPLSLRKSLFATLFTS
jgi:hypothetical protein